MLAPRRARKGVLMAFSVLVGDAREDGVRRGELTLCRVRVSIYFFLDTFGASMPLMPAMTGGDRCADLRSRLPAAQTCVCSARDVMSQRECPYAAPTALMRRAF